MNEYSVSGDSIKFEVTVPDILSARPPVHLKMSVLKKHDLLMSTIKKVYKEETINMSNKEEKALASFTEKTTKTNDFQSNAFKVTSVAASSTSKIDKTSPIKRSPLKPAHERFKHLAESPSTSLLLPTKYKILCEMFQSMDTVVSILNNRKEKITLEKVKEGVQKMMKRNLEMRLLLEFLGVFPWAYTLKVEKIAEKIDGKLYELIVLPNLTEDKDGNYVAEPDTFVTMDSQSLLRRRKECYDRILKHHQEELINQSNKEEKALASFAEKTSKPNDFQSNAVKVTSVAASSTSKIDKTSPIKRSSIKPVQERFKRLAESPSTSLLLPTKYKILCEMFQSMDTVVSILNNRKEKITLEKVKEEVQKIMKRNFDMRLLLEFLGVFPWAYTLKVEKNPEKIDCKLFEMIVLPNLTEDKDGNYVADPDTFVTMDSQILLRRRKECYDRILKHHQENSVSGDAIQVEIDSLPDNLSVELPKPADSKMCAAKKFDFFMSTNTKMYEVLKESLKIDEESAVVEKKEDRVEYSDRHISTSISVEKEPPKPVKSAAPVDNDEDDLDIDPFNNNLC